MYTDLLFAWLYCTNFTLALYINPAHNSSLGASNQTTALPFLSTMTGTGTLVKQGSVRLQLDTLMIFMVQGTVLLSILDNSK